MKAAEIVIFLTRVEKIKTQNETESESKIQVSQKFPSGFWNFRFL
jgi:hypothetical protein